MWAVQNVVFRCFSFPTITRAFLLLSVCLIGRNLGRLFQDGVCTVLSVIFDYRCKRKAGDLCHFWRGEEVFNLTN